MLHSDPDLDLERDCTWRRWSVVNKMRSTGLARIPCPLSMHLLSGVRSIQLEAGTSTLLGTCHLLDMGPLRQVRTW